MDLNKETMNKIRNLILFTVVVVIVGINYQKLFLLFGRLLGMCSPFLMGAAIAFILNVPMRSMEKHIMTGRKSKLRRPISLCLTILVVAGVLGLVTFVVVPELLRTLMILQNSIPAFVNEVKDQAEQLFIQYPEIVDYINGIEIDWKQVMEDTVTFLSTGAGTVLSGTLSAAFSIASGVVNFGIGFIFAIYILLQKENLARQMQRLMKAYLPAEMFKKSMEIAVLAEKTFSNFLAGQCLEAVILGMMFFITLSVFRMPYALLIGVLIAFTALIPIFGAFIGCVVGAFLMLMMNPVSALSFVIIFFVLQQVEGNLIYPHVVGNSVGLPSIWVLVAVTLGGSAFGVVGMLVFIPLCSVLYSLLRQAVNERLQKNQRTGSRQAQMVRSKKPENGK